MGKEYRTYQWRIWWILAFSFVLSLFHRGATAVVSQELASALHLNATELGNVASITFYTYAFLQIPAGILLDRYGSKKCSMAGMFLTGLGSILLGGAHSVWMAYLGRMFVGAGTSVIFISILQTQGIWFAPKEFSSASSKLSFIGNMGGLLATFPLATLVLYLGWRGSFYFMGVICFVVAFGIGVLVKDRPEAYGFTALGFQPLKVQVGIVEGILQVIQNPSTWRNFFVLFSLVGGTTTLTGLWGVGYLTSVYGISTSRSAFYLSFIVYGLIVGSIVVGKVVDWCKGNYICYPRVAMGIILILWVYILVVCEGKPPLTSIPILFFIMGMLAMSHILAFTSIKEETTPSVTGLATSIVNSGEFIGSSLLSLGIGVVLDFLWSGKLENGVRIYSIEAYRGAFFLFLLLPIIGILMSFVSKKEKSIGGQ